MSYTGVQGLRARGGVTLRWICGLLQRSRSPEHAYCMNSSETNCKVTEEKASCALLLKRWRRELLIDESKGDADAMELDRRMLDYYLDQYTSTAKLHPVENRSLN